MRGPRSVPRSRAPAPGHCPAGRAVGGERGDGRSVGPVRHRARRTARPWSPHHDPADRRRPGRARPSGAHQRQRRERVRVVECGDLSDHPADPDAAEVSRHGVERADQRRRVGGEIAQMVPRRLRVDGRRRSAVAQVVTDHPTATCREPLTHRVGPRHIVGPRPAARVDRHRGRRSRRRVQRRSPARRSSCSLSFLPIGSAPLLLLTPGPPETHRHRLRAASGAAVEFRARSGPRPAPSPRPARRVVGMD